MFHRFTYVYYKVPICFRVVFSASVLEVTRLFCLYLQLHACGCTLNTEIAADTSRWNSGHQELLTTRLFIGITVCSFPSQADKSTFPSVSIIFHVTCHRRSQISSSDLRLHARGFTTKLVAARLSLFGLTLHLTQAAVYTVHFSSIIICKSTH